jgi:hypothetical protein
MFEYVLNRAKETATWVTILGALSTALLPLPIAASITGVLTVILPSGKFIGLGAKK